MKKLAYILYEMLVENKEAQLKKLFVKSEKLTDDEFDRIIKADPTPAKKYSEWLMNRYYKDYKKPWLDSEKKVGRDKIRHFFEDLPAQTDNLELFSRLGHKFPKKNIQDYKYDEFQQVAAEVEDNLSPEELTHGVQADLKYPELVIGKVAGYTVYKFPQGKKELESAMCDLAQGYGWCTTGGSYQTYNRKDTLYMFVKGRKKFLHDQESGQWMGKGNKPMKTYEPELMKQFQQFIREKEGRIYDKGELGKLDKYKIKDIEAGDQTIPIYQIGPKYYTVINKETFTFDTDSKKFKDVNGKNMSINLLFKEPYQSFLEEVYRLLASRDQKKLFPALYRLLLNLDVPKKEEGEYFEIPGSLALDQTDLTSLPNNMKIEGSLSLADSKIQELPRNLIVGKDLDLERTNIKTIPPDLQVGGILNVIDTGVKEIPPTAKIGEVLKTRD